MTLKKFLKKATKDIEKVTEKAAQDAERVGEKAISYVEQGAKKISDKSADESVTREISNQSVISKSQENNQQNLEQAKEENAKSLQFDSLLDQPPPDDYSIINPELLGNNIDSAQN